MIGSKAVRGVSFDAQSGSLIVENYGPGSRVHELSSWKNGFDHHCLDGSDPVDMILLSQKARLDDGDRLALDAFVSSIPVDVVNLVSPISHAQLQELQLLCKGGEAALELAHDAPVLIWLLACAVLSRKVPLSKALSLMKGKRLEIVRAFFPGGTKQHLKLINRVRAIRYSVDELRTLYGVMNSDGIQRDVQHCSSLVLPLVAEVLDSPKLLTIPLIQREVSNESASKFRMKTARTMCETCLRLGKEGGLSNVGHILRNCKTLEEVTALSNKWHGRYNRKLNEETAALNREREAAAAWRRVILEEERRRAQLARDRKAERQARISERRRQRTAKKEEARRVGFRPPPIPGNEHIVPITSHNDLVWEGEVMNNCVASYEDSIVNGDSYIYKVYYPERCTLEIVGKRRFHVGELRAKSNARPQKGVKEYVQQWIQEHGCSSNDGDSREG